MKRKFTRKQVTLMIIGILIILLLIFTAAYAFLGPVIGAGSKTDLDVTIKGVDLLKLEAGDPINLTIGSHNLHDAAANVEGETFARATLIPNKTTLTATKYYNLGMNIANNTFVYSDGSTPEILLQLFDPEGNVITTAGDLSYVTINGVSGFDITTATGKITLASSREINATTEEGTVENWVIKVIILNLPDVDQTPNANASFEMDTAVNEEGEITEPILIHEKIEADAVLSNDLATISVDNSIRYVGADVNNYVCFGSDEEICPEDNLYQMIGLFDKGSLVTKIMKVTPVETNQSDTTAIIDYLNTAFYDTIPIKYQNMIKSTNLAIGSSNEVYDLGRYYAEGSTRYNLEGCKMSDLKNVGFINLSEYDYSISNHETYMQNNIGTYTESGTLSSSLRPTIYLNSAVAFSNGNGSENNPYRLEQLEDDNIAINTESNILKVNLPTNNYSLTKIVDLEPENPDEGGEPENPDIILDLVFNGFIIINNNNIYNTGIIYTRCGYTFPEFQILVENPTGAILHYNVVNSVDEYSLVTLDVNTGTFNLILNNDAISKLSYMQSVSDNYRFKISNGTSEIETPSFSFTIFKN